MNSIIQPSICAYGKKADTGLAVNCRPNEYGGMANHTTGISFLYEYNEKKSFMENTKAVHRLIYKKLNNDKMKFIVLHFIDMMDSSLMDSACMTTYGEYNNKAAKKFTHLMGYDGNPKDVSMTNLTKLNIPIRYGEYDIVDFVFVAPIVPYGQRVIGIATLGDEMNITMHVMEDSRLDYEKKIFEKAMGVLKRIK